MRKLRSIFRNALRNMVVFAVISAFVLAVIDTESKRQYLQIVNAIVSGYLAQLIPKDDNEM